MSTTGVTIISLSAANFARLKEIYSVMCSDVNKATGCKAKAKDLGFKAKPKAKAKILALSPRPRRIDLTP